ncbi:DUF4087 domain-containing protein [Roseomonas sp. WA12]
MRAGRAALLLVALAFPAGAEAAERRCGWLANPTPGNYWLNDRDAEWTLSEQGGEPVAGMDVMPDFTTRDWVRTNGYYGYGCACLVMETDRTTKRVLRILSAEQLPLARCRADRALRIPE